MIVIKTGQIWDAASGEPFGLIVLSPPDQRDDVRIIHFRLSNRRVVRFLTPTTIDAFKLTYRYKLRTKR